jgi:predicted anti-sigma-YlaC factor YlaD
MNRECHEVRKRLTSKNAAGVERHLADCPACRRYAGRLQAARRCFEAHHGGVEPDAAFAARVAQRLNGRPVAALGWAAFRLLPAMIVLALILAWFAFQTAPSYAETNDSLAPTDDLVGWLLEQPENGP